METGGRGLVTVLLASSWREGEHVTQLPLDHVWAEFLRAQLRPSPCMSMSQKAPLQPRINSLLVNTIPKNVIRCPNRGNREGQKERGVQCGGRQSAWHPQGPRLTRHSWLGRILPSSGQGSNPCTTEPQRQQWPTHTGQFEGGAVGSQLPTVWGL